MALVAASIVVGVKVIGGADDTVEVWAVRSDLATGQEVGSDDLVSRRVHLEAEADLYLPTDEGLPESTTLLRKVGAGELLPKKALGDPEDGLERVTLSASPEVVPRKLERGQLVNVWIVTRSDAGGEKPQKPKPVLEDVVVLDAPQPEDTLGFSGNRQILVGVPPSMSSRIGVVLQGVRDDNIQLTRR